MLPIEQRFQQFVEAMKVIHEPRVDKKKVYVKLDEKRNITTITDKKGKNIRAEELAKIAEEIILNRTKSGGFSQDDRERLHDVIKGLSTLHYRIESYKKSQSRIKAFIFSLFGVQDKSTAVLEQINKTKIIAQTIKYRLEIQNLEQSISIFKKNIEEKEIELKNLKQNPTKLQLEQAQQEFKSEIEQLENKLTELTSSKDELDVQSQKSMDAQTKIEPALDELVKKVHDKESKSKKTKVKEKVKGFFTYPFKKKSEVEAASQTLGKTSSEAQKIGNKIKTIQERMTVIEDELDVTKKNLSPLLQKIEQKDEELVKNEQDLKEAQNELTIKQSKLRQLSPPMALPQEREVRLTAAPKTTSPIFTPPQKANYREELLMNEIKSSLGLEMENTERNEKYQRRLIFGFSVGQKQTIEELSKLDQSFKITDLEKILEGGEGVTNMFYIANYLEHYIPQAKSENMDQKYIKHLEQMQSDLKRSLPFALKSRALERLNEQLAEKKGKQFFERHPESLTIELNRLCTGMLREIELLEPGESLLLPVGTREHETLICFKKEENGKVATSMYNTGEGVEANRKKSVSGLYAAFQGKFPIKRTYKPLAFNKDDFSKMMTSILENRIAKGNIDDLTTKLKELGSVTLGKPKNVQINGVCSFQVLTEYSEDFLGKNYSQFKYDLLRHVQEDFQDLTNSIVSEDYQIENKPMILKLHETMLADNQEEIYETARKLK